MSETNENLNQGFTMTMESTDVITVPIDSTLTQEGEAADAKAVGDALALKADASSVNTIDVNGEAADNQGHIILTGEHIPMSGSDETTLKSAIETASNRTGADIPLTADSGAATIAAVIANLGTETAQSIPMSTADSTPVSTKIIALETAAAAMVKSVNGNTPDENGNVAVNEVMLAQNLTSDQSQAVTAPFILRTTGGSRSVGSGSAQVQEIRGAMNHTGVVQEVLDWDLDETSGITMELDHDEWVTAVEDSGTYVFSYNSAWKLDSETVDITDYGITVTGDPANGDSITVTYVKEDRGTITVATPTAFRATGWNLFNASTGYARVVAYDGAYHVGGTYTELKYSATLNGEKSGITVTNSSFTVPGDGYVWVTGGNATNTYITTEWTDWTAGPDVAWAAYSESVINLATIMSTYFPYGLMAVGAVYDSISIDQSKYFSRIERIAYDPEDLADIIEEGRAYEVDENYIYVVKTTASSGSITISGAVTASDHGIEVVDGTEVGPVVSILYGQNLKAKLVNDVVTISKQDLTPEQQAQVLENIGAGSAEEVAKLGTLARRSVTIAYPSSFAADADYSANLYTKINSDLPAGYKFLTIAGWDSGGKKINIYRCKYVNSSSSFGAWNGASAAYTNKSATVYYLCIKS